MKKIYFLIGLLVVTIVYAFYLNFCVEHKLYTNKATVEFRETEKKP